MDVLHEGLARLGFAGEKLIFVEDKMNEYIKEILLFNKRHRMINTDDRDEIAVRHVLDTLAALSFMKECLKDTASPTPVIADVGSGAGLPGIPLSCAMIDCRFILIERMANRAAFLENVIAVLRLNNAEVLQCDAAAAAQKHFADIVTARAYSPVDKKSIAVYTSLAKAGGTVALYKTPKDAFAAQDDIVKAGEDFCVTPLCVPFMEERERCIMSYKTRGE